eukprot:712640-Prorocentrum_lima.AAC.1
MTSSLVGSEMCIRDSVCAGYYQGMVSWWHCAACLHLPLDRWLLWVAQQAVSYTHLTLPTICSV